MSKRVLYTLLAVSIGLNLGMIGTTVAYRTSRPAPPSPGPADRAGPEKFVEEHVAGITNHLGLDAEQSGAVREILERRVSELMRMRERAELATRRLSDGFAAPEFDSDLFLQLSRDANRAKADVDSIAALILVEEAAVLTPEQRRRFAEVAPEIHGRPFTPPPREGPPPRGGARP